MGVCPPPRPAPSAHAHFRAQRRRSVVRSSYRPWCVRVLRDRCAPLWLMRPPPSRCAAGWGGASITGTAPRLPFVLLLLAACRSLVQWLMCTALPPRVCRAIECAAPGGHRAPHRAGLFRGSIIHMGTIEGQATVCLPFSLFLPLS